MLKGFKKLQLILLIWILQCSFSLQNHKIPHTKESIFQGEKISDLIEPSGQSKIKRGHQVWMQKVNDFSLACHGLYSQFEWKFHSNFEVRKAWKDQFTFVRSTSQVSCGETKDSFLYERPPGYCTSHLNLTSFDHINLSSNMTDNNGVILILCKQSEGVYSENYATFFKCGHKIQKWLQVHVDTHDLAKWANVSCEPIVLDMDKSTGNCVCKTATESFQPTLMTCIGNLTQCQDSINSDYSNSRFRGTLKYLCNETKFDKNVTKGLNFSIPGMIICESQTNFAFIPFLPPEISGNGQTFIEIVNGNASTFGKYMKLELVDPPDLNASTETGGLLLCSAPQFLFSSTPGHGIKWFFINQTGQNVSLGKGSNGDEFSNYIPKEYIVSLLIFQKDQFVSFQDTGVEIICEASTKIRVQNQLKPFYVHTKLKIPAPNPAVQIQLGCIHSQATESGHSLQFNCRNEYGVSLKWFTQNEQDLCANDKGDIQKMEFHCPSYNPENNFRQLNFVQLECPKQNVSCSGTTKNNIEAFATLTPEMCNQFLKNDKNACMINNSTPSEDVIIIASSAVATVLLLLICSLLLFRKLQNSYNEFSDEEIKEFIDGVESNTNNENVAFFLPYNTQLEIPLENIEFDTMVLGSGEFGQVVKGTVQSQLVAIKRLKPSADLIAFKTHLSELKIMSFVGRHDHIVQLIGASTARIKKRNVYLIYEFCSNGNLLNYIRERRNIFVNQLEDDHYKSTAETVVSYENASTKKLCSEDLIRWAYEISCGMEYVASLKIYHGDLALRNILLTQDLTAKIGDFGLSKQLYQQYSVYVQTKEQALPLKWLALESLRDLEFSIQSDLWSFGICMWELFSLGSIPYPGILEFNFQAWTFLNEGHRMDRPDAASTKLYDVMLKCWNSDPASRPSFIQLKEILELQLKTFKKQ